MTDNSKESISGPCVVCDNIVSFEAPTCPKCGQPDAGKKAKEAAEKPLTKEESEHVVTCSECGESFEFHEFGFGHAASNFISGAVPFGLGTFHTVFWNPHKDKPSRDAGCPHCGNRDIPKDAKPKK